MANFSAAFGYDFFIVPVQNSEVANFESAPSIDSSTPVADTATVSYSSGVFTIAGSPLTMDGSDTPVRLSSLTNAALETDTGSEEVYTYDDESKGYSQAVATTKSFSISLSGIADFNDAAYKVLRLTEQNTVADGLRVAFKRVGPTGTTETIEGYGTLTGYTESNEVTSIVSWECTLTGYGPYHLTLASQLTGGIASVDTLATSSAFALSGTGLAVDITGGGGSAADATVDTDGSGDVTTVAITSPGSGYAVGNIITISETAGSGIATARVASVA